jgi:hypothetical protein
LISAHSIKVFNINNCLELMTIDSYDFFHSFKAIVLGKWFSIYMGVRNLFLWVVVIAWKIIPYKLMLIDKESIQKNVYQTRKVFLKFSFLKGVCNDWFLPNQSVLHLWNLNIIQMLLSLTRTWKILFNVNMKNTF